METCIRRGLSTEGELPGPLRIARRAAALRRDLDSTAEHRSVDAMARLSAYAIAVNEENAAGHQVVTAPTNGAAGIVPAVLAYYAWHNDGANDDRIVDFLATAGAVGMLYKRNASISGAEMGCQGEVGVACSMA
ncbi:MAG: L-serine ammonia-lyase, partial [Gammaproteobacteria bacterium]|nr:L-serine ammonia-lyase [Gammaproteobacteria bacterium]